MSRPWTVPWLLLFVAQAATAQVSGPPPVPAARQAASARVPRAEQGLLAGPRVASLVAALQSDRFLVTPGRMYWPNVVALACAGVSPSCNGNNDKNPYFLTILPEPGQVLGSPLEHLEFQIRRDEAVLLVGLTPPPLAYFSFTPFVMNRWFEREGIRRKVFASTGDPHNMLTFNTAGKAMGDPYDRAFVLLLVSDKGTASRVRTALRATGFPDQIVNELVISPSYARMSSTVNGDPDPVKDDSFVLLQRFALWEYGFEEAGQAYLADPPINVFRLTPDPRTGKSSYAALPVERIRPRGTGLTELDLLPEVEALRDAIVARYPGMTAQDLRPATWLEESFVAIQADRDVLGESRDTVYLRNEGTFGLADDELLIVYGVNHEATGKATYSGFAIYEECRACPSAGENSRRFGGSALDYFAGAPSRPAHLDKLYAWKLARSCGADPRCSEVPPGSCGATPPVMDSGGGLFVGFRAYVEPSTKVGPAFSELVYDRVLRLTPAAPSITNVKVTAAGGTEPVTVVPAGTALDVSFTLEGSDPSTISWSARVKGDDGCGTFTTVSDRSETTPRTVTTRLSVPPTQRTLLSFYLDAADAKGRHAKTLGLQVRFR